ncbi:MAG: galactokinase [Oscillospiraceae bacterium]|nr:galactokinase [Oscillospiraceae bacterium]
MRAKELLTALRSGACDARLRAVYGEQADLTDVRERIGSVVRGFTAHFDPDETRELSIFSAPGRTELGGNHTDHQHGCGLAASVDMDTLACVARNADTTIRVLSKGHDAVELDVGDLAVRAQERSRSQSLVRGCAARMSALGSRIGGFDAYTETRVLRGSGLSSSAAFEVLIAQIMNGLFCDGRFDTTQIAKIGQYAENVYYGKPCGLLDQLACSTGGVIAIDFADPAAPVIERCAVDFTRAGYALVVIDSGANHSDLDNAYAAIPGEMCAVARWFGAEHLHEVDEAAFFARRAEALAALGERPVLRAEHFFAETKRAQAQLAALRRGDFAAYLALVRASGESSETKLQNVRLDRPDGDRLLRVIRRAQALAGPTGAARVHGGGFAGTAQAYVPLDRLDAFTAAMEADFGKGCCHIVRIRNVGGTQLL